MELNREQIANGLFASALFGIGVLVGNPLIGGILTNISGNVASNALQAKWSQICQEFFQAPNHDLQKLWARAVRRSLGQMEDLWWKTARGSQIKLGDPEQRDAITQAFHRLQADADRFCVSANLAEIAADVYFDLARLSGADLALAHRVFAARLRLYLEGYDEQLLAFLDQHFLEVFGFWFVEELKRDDSESKRAWKSLQLYLLRDLEAQVAQLQVDQRKTLQLMEDLTAWSAHIEASRNEQSENAAQQLLQRITVEAEERLVRSLAQVSGLVREDIEAGLALFSEAVYEQVREVVRAEVPQIIRRELETMQWDTLPPPKSVVPEATSFFVGREAELAYYARQLDLHHLAVLTGIAGIGKTALATKLAHATADEDRILWHTFHHDEDLNVLLWRVAAFLYWRDHQDLWRRLHAVELSRHKAPPEILLEYLMPALRGKEYLFCLDGLQFVDQTAQMIQFLEKLVAAAQDSQLLLIITSRHTNALPSDSAAEPLSGLTAKDAQRLLVSQGVSLMDGSFQIVYKSTDGNPQLLMLAADILRASKEPEGIIDGLFQSDNIEGYLVNEIDKTLSADERSTLSVMSALFGHAASRGAIDALLAGPSARQSLWELSQRYLVAVQGEGRDRLYTLHPVLQKFYYTDLSRVKRQQVHQRAGEYNEREEISVLQAALHYQQAGMTEKAVHLATSNIWPIITQGHARRLQQLLESLRSAELYLAQRTNVDLALGEVSEILGGYTAAIGYFTEVLARLKDIPGSAPDALLASLIARRIGRLYGWQGQLETALEWMQAARAYLASAPGASATEALAMVEIHSASLYYQMGRYQQAETLAYGGLNLLGATGSLAARAEGYLLLGAAQDAQGKSTDALSAYQTSVELWSSVNDTYQMARVNNNIGAAYFNRGEWSRAREIYTNVYRYFSEGVEDRYRLAATSTNLGLLAYNQGLYDAAQKYHSETLAIAQELGILWLAAVARVNMAWVHLARRELGAAEELAKENVRLQSISEIAESLPESCRVLAHVAAHRGLLEQAHDYAQRALDLACEQSNKLEEANAQRALGKVSRLQNQTELARQHLNVSLDLLRALQNRFESARTERQLVWLCKDGGDDTTALVHAVSALTAFAEMEARGELESMQMNDRLTFRIFHSLPDAAKQCGAVMTDAGWIRQDSVHPVSTTTEALALGFSIGIFTAQLVLVAGESAVVLTIRACAGASVGNNGD